MFNSKKSTADIASSLDNVHTAKPPGTQIQYPFEVKKVSVDNMELVYVDEGKGDNILLFLHGVGSCIPIWKKNIKALRNNYRCIAVDLPGHGYSDKGDHTYSIQFYVDVLFKFIKKLDLSSVILVGHSMGGQISVKAGLQDPALIKKIVLISPAGLEPYYLFERQMLLNCMALVVTSGNAFAHNDLNYLIGSDYDKSLAEEMLSQLAFFKNDSLQFGKMLLRSTRGMLFEPIRSDLQKLSQECLVMVGINDQVCPYNYLRIETYADMAFNTAKKIPNGKVLQLNGNHFLQYQKADFINNELDKFIKQGIFAPSDNV